MRLVLRLLQIRNYLVEDNIEERDVSPFSFYNLIFIEKNDIIIIEKNKERNN